MKKKKPTKKTHNGDIVIADFKVPKFFLADINIPLQKTLKNFGIDTVLTIHKRKEIDELFDELVAKLNREDVAMVKGYFACLKETAWAKMYLLNEDIREYEVLVYSPEDMRIYAVEERADKTPDPIEVEIEIGPDKKKEDKSNPK